MHQAMQAAADRVAAKRAELERRLAELRLIVNPVTKMQHAPLVAAAAYELLDHQAAFNAAVIEAFIRLAARDAKDLAELGAALERNVAAARGAGA